MDNLAIFPTILLLELATQVEGKHCYYTNGESTSYYYCGGYEYCCNRGCCENFISFYRLWYFWFCVALLLLFCSGGGYWYRKRYVQRIIVSQSPQSATIISMATANHGSAGANCIQLPDGSTIGTAISDTPPSYNQVGYPPGPYPPYTKQATNGVVLLTEQGVVYQGASYGPPPSYDSVYPTQHAGQQTE